MAGVPAACQAANIWSSIWLEKMLAGVHIVNRLAVITATARMVSTPFQMVQFAWGVGARIVRIGRRGGVGGGVCGAGGGVVSVIVILSPDYTNELQV